MVTTHRGARITYVLDLPTKRPGLTRWEVGFSLPVYDPFLATNAIMAATVDPFTADTCELARLSGQPVTVVVRGGRFGLDILSVEADRLSEREETHHGSASL